MPTDEEGRPNSAQFRYSAVIDEASFVAAETRMAALVAKIEASTAKIKTSAQQAAKAPASTSGGGGLVSSSTAVAASSVISAQSAISTANTAKTTSEALSKSVTSSTKAIADQSIVISRTYRDANREAQNTVYSNEKVAESIKKVTAANREAASSGPTIIRGGGESSEDRLAGLKAQETQFAKEQAVRDRVAELASGRKPVGTGSSASALAEAESIRNARRLHPIEYLKNLYGKYAQTDPGDEGLDEPESPAEAGAGAAGGGRGGLFAKRRIVTSAGRALGLGGLTQDASLGLYGSTFAAIGAGLAGVAAVKELVSLQDQAIKSQVSMALAVKDTGSGFGELTSNATTFASVLGTSRDQARELAAAVADLTLHTGGTLNAGDVSAKLGVIGQARGLSPEELSKTIRDLGRGGSSGQAAYQSLTGRDAELELDRYAKSLGTIATRLTPLQQGYALTNAALKQYSEYTALAGQRTDSIAFKFQVLKNTLGDFAEEYAVAVGETFTSSEKFTYGLSTILGGRGGADPYGGERAKQAAENKAYADKVKAEAAAKGVTAAPGAGGTDSASADVRLKDAQNTIKQTYNSFFEDQDRLNALAGRNQTGLITQNLLEVAQAFNKVKSTLTGDDQLEFEKKFFGPLNSQLEGLRNTVLGAGNELSNLQPGLIGQKNPYVHFFTDAEEAARRFHNTYDIVGHGFADSLISANNAQINTEKYQQRITDAFKATELEFEAAKLAQPFRELTLVMQNSKAVFDADFKAATENPLLRREAQELEQGYKVPRYQAGQQDQANLARLVSDPRAAGSDRGSRAIRSEIDKYVLGLTQGARPEDRNSTDPALRYRAQQRARALRDTAEENDAAIQDAIAKVQINNYGVNLAQGKLAELNSLSRNAPGEARNITRGAFLQATDSLPREALTPELLKGRIGALQEEAQYRRSQEKLAAEAAEATKKLQQYLVGEGGNGGLLTQLLNAVMSGNNKLLLEIIRKADTVDVSATLQNSPSAKPSGEYTPTAADRQALSGSTF